MLTKAISKRANCDSLKDIEDISNVITDIDSVTAINNCVNNCIKISFGKTIRYMNNKRYYLALN